MIAVLSPAKSLDFESPCDDVTPTRPDFLPDASRLVKRARQLSQDDLRQLMGISENLAELNHQRFRRFKLRPKLPQDGKPAAMAFQGDVYQGLRADTLATRDLEFAQEHLRILSGLYGLLRPLDGIQPYRLEMGLRLDNERGKDLYAFWGDKLSKALDKALRSRPNKVVVNLASNEYSKAAVRKALKARVVDIVFKEVKPGQEPKVISFMAKRARGEMARFLVEERLEAPEALKDYSQGDYRFQPDVSSDDRWEFHRPFRSMAAN